MKRKINHFKKLCMVPMIMFIFSACNQESKNQTEQVVDIKLSDEQILVDGTKIEKDEKNAVYAANDIIYYEDGKDFTYGEGSKKDAHSEEEAAAHTVIHITEPGTYRLSGTLSLGQVAVDLGEDAKKNPDAVVTLILNGADITCEVAPAVIFYNVYECGDDDEDQATKDVDTSAAGANVIICDDTINTINGSYVEKIYKPESVVLNEEKTKVEDAKKLHKYDGAFYSRMSMNMDGEEKNTGVLNINAENEGLDSEIHLTINGGTINILSRNDGINTNEDGISVTTVNDGKLNIRVTGDTGEGDGIDSNGWLVINGGAVTSFACSDSMDSGIDSDMGIHINGGTVIASGNMLDEIEEGGQNYAVFQFAQKQNKKEPLSLRNSDGITILEICPENAYSVFVYSSSELKEGTYTLWSNERQFRQGSGVMAGPGRKPGGEMPLPEGFEGKMPEGENPFPEGFEGKMPGGENPFPEGFEGEKPGGEMPLPEGLEGKEQPEEFITEFLIKTGKNMFSNVSCME